MKSQVSVLSQVINYALGFAVLWFVYFIVKETFIFFNSLNSQFAMSLVAASVTIIISVISLLVGKFMEQKYKVQQEIRDKKVPIYEKIIGFFFKIVKNAKCGDTMTEEEMNDFMLTITEQIIIWGSDDVIKAFNYFRNIAIEHDKNKNSNQMVNLVDALEKLFYAIRKDLGHENKELSNGTLVSLFINDYENSLSKYIKAQ